MDRFSDVGHVLHEATKDRLLLACVKWRDKYKPRAPECLQQVDEINLACPELAEEVCGIIGYWEDKDGEA
jgi:hypothetical protein